MKSRIYIRLPNWIGDVCMAYPCLQALLQQDQCEVVICAKPWAADILKGVSGFAFLPLTGQFRYDSQVIKHHLIQYPVEQAKGLILPQSLTSAITFKLAGLKSAGYVGEWRSPLLTWRYPHPTETLHRVRFWYHLTQLALQDWGIQSSYELSSDYTIPITAEAQAQADQLLAQHSLHQFIFIAPTAVGLHKGQNKVWPGFNQYTQAMQSTGHQIVMCPPPNERNQAMENAPSAYCLSSVSLDVLLGILKRSQLVVCNDSGIAHLTAAVGTPQITLIGVTEPEITAPWSTHAKIMGKLGTWPSISSVVQASC